MMVSFALVMVSNLTQESLECFPVVLWLCDSKEMYQNTVFHIQSLNGLYHFSSVYIYIYARIHSWQSGGTHTHYMNIYIYIPPTES